jgi:uncharacterized protein
MTVTTSLRISQEDIASFCRRNVDVLVDFEPNAGHSLFDFVRMQEELGHLFGRQIDLVEKSGLHNPFRRYEILRTRQVIFAA